MSANEVMPAIWPNGGTLCPITPRISSVANGIISLKSHKKQLARQNNQSIILPMSKQDKITSTIKFIQGKLDNGWNLQEVIVNSKNLWHLSNRDMKTVAEFFKQKI